MFPQPVVVSTTSGLFPFSIRWQVIAVVLRKGDGTIPVDHNRKVGLAWQYLEFVQIPLNVGAQVIKPGTNRHAVVKASVRIDRVSRACDFPGNKSGVQEIRVLSDRDLVFA